MIKLVVRGVVISRKLAKLRQFSQITEVETEDLRLKAGASQSFSNASVSKFNETPGEEKFQKTKHDFKPSKVSKNQIMPYYDHFFEFKNDGLDEDFEEDLSSSSHEKENQLNILLKDGKDLDLDNLINKIFEKYENENEQVSFLSKCLITLIAKPKAYSDFPQTLKGLFELSVKFARTIKPQNSSTIHFSKQKIKLFINFLFFFNRFFPSYPEISSFWSSLANLDFTQYTKMQMCSLFYVFLSNPMVKRTPFVLKNSSNLVFIHRLISTYFPDPAFQSNNNSPESSQADISEIPDQMFQLFIQAYLCEEFENNNHIFSQMVHVAYALSRSKDLNNLFILRFSRFCQLKGVFRYLTTSDLCTCLYVLHSHPQIDPGNKIELLLYSRILEEKKGLAEDSVFVCFLSLRKFSDRLKYSKPETTTSENTDLVVQFCNYCLKSYFLNYRRFSFETNCKVLYEISHNIKTLSHAEFSNNHFSTYLWTELKGHGSSLSLYDLITFGFVMKRYFYINAESYANWSLFLKLMEKKITMGATVLELNRINQIVLNLEDLLKRKNPDAKINSSILLILKVFAEKNLQKQ
jgi:hypothetical protein